MNIIPNYETPKFFNQLKFELKSWIGRSFFSRRSKIQALNGLPLLIDIGVGANFREGWVHVDFFSLRLRFWKKINRRAEVETDLRYPLLSTNEIANGVYSCHTIEHLYPKEAYRLLAEILRILKPGGWLRLGVPDLQVALDFYNGKISMPEYKCRAEAIAHLTQDWGHHSVWDEELLTHALKSVGFINIKKVQFGTEGSDRRLIKEEDARRTWTLVMEAQKPATLFFATD